jgi:tRNA (cytidine/uridine-2'-O-)-methyltransferase
MALHIVLHEPEIPQNTGNIARTCVATGARLHIIHPIGFDIGERAVRRAGLDYWDRLQLKQWQSLEDFFAFAGVENCWFVSTKAKRSHCEPSYPDTAFFLFGKESAGLPEQLMSRHPDRSLRIPMTEGNRSLNLSNAAAIIAYEYLRQKDFRFNLE